jgi:hypothetical protein
MDTPHRVSRLLYLAAPPRRPQLTVYNIIVCDHDHPTEQLLQKQLVL